MGLLREGLRPAWSSSSFLLYAGALTVLVSLLVLLGTLGDLHGSWALVGWSALALAVLLAAAAAARRRGRPLAAGLLAFVAVAVVAVLTGALLEAIGLADDVAPFDRDLELAPLVVEVVALVAALWAARRFRVPLLALAATVAKAVLVLDTTAGLVGTGNWLATAALLLGLLELAIAVSLDGGEGRAWALWKHVAAGVLIGGAVVWFLEGGDVGWVLIGVVALLYVALARSLERSSWAVLGALGLFIVAVHFVDEGERVIGVATFGSAGDDAGLETWQTALAFVALGALYGVLGLLLRQRTLHDEPPA